MSSFVPKGPVFLKEAAPPTAGGPRSGVRRALNVKLPGSEVLPVFPGTPELFAPTAALHIFCVLTTKPFH